MKSELPTQEILLRRSLPVVVNSFNQYTYLKNLLEKLESDGFRNFMIVDNNSTYAPLLSYYDELNKSGKAAVILYGENKGPHFFHMKGVYKLFGSLPHIYTDPDLDYDFLAPTFLTELMTVSEKYSMFKVGPALQIPHSYEIDEMMYCDQDGVRWGIADWESRYWKEQVDEGLFYPGHIDTTFHLFNPTYFKVGSDLIDGIRIGKDGFIFKHLPWYKNKISPKDESDFYANHVTEKSSWKSSRL
jgi:hypothetical protein